MREIIKRKSRMRKDRKNRTQHFLLEGTGEGKKVMY